MKKDISGTFISLEATTYFPENNCKIRCRCIGITEQQFYGYSGNAMRPALAGLTRYIATVETSKRQQEQHPGLTMTGNV
jgi:hypothetical protein